MIRKQGNKYTPHLVTAGLILVTLAAYWHVLRCGFVFDDAYYLTGNPHLQQGLTSESVKWAFTAYYGANWYPLTWMSHMLDYVLFGSNPAGHHAVNLLFHLLNTVLLLLVLRRMTGSLWRSALVAALFAVHPLHVESVAWVAERKDVLSTFFMMLTLLAYVHYTERRDLRRYIPVVVLFALGLMAKPMLVSLPILLLLLDYWPLRRSERSDRPQHQAPSAKHLLMEKLPLFALSVASCVVTYLAQRSGEAVIELARFPIGLRIANAAVSYAAYLWKMLWPTSLAAYYPYPSHGIAAHVVLIAVLVLAVITFAVLQLRRSRPCLLAGWLWYVVSLVPVIGLVQVGAQSMADRYTYIPLIGVFVMIAWGVPDLLRHSARLRMPLFAVSLLVVAALALCTSGQVRFWESNYTLFKRVVSVTEGNALALSNYGLALADKGKHREAAEQYRKAISADPHYVQSYLNLGNALKELGDVKGAMEQYSQALKIDPDYQDASVAIANIMADQGRSDLAAGEYNKALESDPEDATAHYNLGRVLADQGKLDDAISHFERAIKSKPDFDKAHFNLAVVLSRTGDAQGAAAHYGEALKINSNYAEAHHGLAVILAMQGKSDEAGERFRAAVRLKPDYAEAHNNYGILLAQQGKMDEAQTHFADAVKYSPDYADAYNNLGRVLSAKGRSDDAIAAYSKAVRVRPDYVQAHASLAMEYFAKGMYAEAWQEVGICEKYGAKPPEDFLKALSSRMPRR